MQIRFLAKRRPVYNHPKFRLYTGQTVEVADSEGERILKDYPDDFEIVVGETKMESPAPFDKMMPPPQFNKGKRGRPRVR